MWSSLQRHALEIKRRKLIFNALTVSCLCNVRFRRIAGIGRAGFVHGTHTELINRSFLQPSDSSLWLRRICYENFLPIRRWFLLHFNDVTGNRYTPGILWRFPFQVYAIHVPVFELGYTRFAGNVWKIAIRALNEAPLIFICAKYH